MKYCTLIRSQYWVAWCSCRLVLPPQGQLPLYNTTRTGILHAVDDPVEHPEAPFVSSIAILDRGMSCPTSQLKFGTRGGIVPEPEEMIA